MKRLKSNFEFRDKRGWLIEVWKGNNWKRMNYLFCRKGCIRGGHFHKKTNELFFVVDGRFRISIVNLRTKKQVEFTARGKDIFMVEPFEAHYIKALKDSRLIALLDDSSAKVGKDIHVYEKRK